MNYKSTRNNEKTVASSYAVLHGLAEDGGLYIPKNLPSINLDYDILKNMSYQETAFYILKEFFIGNLKRIYYRIPRKFILRQIRKTDVKDIFEAMVISNKELKRTNINKILNAFNGQSRII